MQNLSKADKAAARKAAALKAAATKAATAVAAAQAPAPAPDAPKPEAVTLSARAKRLATAEALLASGAHKPNVRTTTSVRIPTGLPKYDFSHLASKPLAARISGLPTGSADFYRTNARAYAGKPMPANQFDNAKLARVISAGLATATGGERDGQHLTGNVIVTFAELPKA